MCKFEGIITEMHSVILNNHFEKNQSNKNNTENSNEDSITVEKWKINVRNIMNINS